MAESAAVGLLVFRPYFTAGTERAADEAVYAAHRLHSQQPQRTRARFRLRRAGQEHPFGVALRPRHIFSSMATLGTVHRRTMLPRWRGLMSQSSAAGLVGELLAAEDLQYVVGEIV